MKCTKCFMYSENPRGSYMKHLVSVMECSGRCSGSLSQVWWLLVGSSRQLCATQVVYNFGTILGCSGCKELADGRTWNLEHQEPPRCFLRKGS